MEFAMTAQQNNKIYETLDKKIKKLSLRKLNSLRYKTPDCHTDDLGILHSLRNLLEAKDKGSECLREYDRDQIINIIKRYL